MEQGPPGEACDRPAGVSQELDTFTRERWEKRWSEEKGPDPYDPAENEMLRDALALIRRHWSPPRSGRFLEAGCGPAANALHLALEGASVTGVDLSRAAVQRAREEFRRRGVKGTFEVADVRHLPRFDAEFDFIYAGGVIEHFRETELALAEFHRCLRPDGGALVTVPALTLSLPYLLLRGNVPSVPIVEGIVAYIHLRILGGRHARFGYERSFTKKRLVCLMRDAGFRAVEVGCFNTYLPLTALPRPFRPLGRRIARFRIFCPMYWALGRR
jgi:SAM-dependent methyltransferase